MADQVPFVDLSRIHAPLKKEILTRIESIIDRSAYVLGADVENFEKEFAAWVGTPYAVGVNSGLDALKLALFALEIGPGDEVIVPANTFIATAYAVTATGAQVVLADAEEDSWNIDPKQIEKVVTKKTKAIIPVHLYGQAASMGAVMELASAHHLAVVEDVAQAHGAMFRGKACGTFGAIGCFSFYPGKNLGAMGEGGAITTSNEALKDRVKMLRNVGQKEKYQHEYIGHNSRLHSMQAAILSVKLPHLKRHNEERLSAAKRYNEMLKGVRGIKLQQPMSDRTHVYHLYVVATGSSQERDALQKHLAQAGVQTGIHYPIPIHLSRCYSHLGKKSGSYPVTEKLAQTMLSLPMFAGITEKEQIQVVEAIQKFYR